MPRGIYARTKKKKGEPPEIRVPLDAVPDKPSKRDEFRKRITLTPKKKGANMAVLAELLVEVAKLL
jgi:hypothetical protein